jgi:hypothetical protein
MCKSRECSMPSSCQGLRSRAARRAPSAAMSSLPPAPFSRLSSHLAGSQRLPCRAPASDPAAVSRVAQIERLVRECCRCCCCTARLPQLPHQCCCRCCCRHGTCCNCCRCCPPSAYNSTCTRAHHSAARHSTGAAQHGGVQHNPQHATAQALECITAQHIQPAAHCAVAALP